MGNTMDSFRKSCTWASRMTGSGKLNMTMSGRLSIFGSWDSGDDHHDVRKVMPCFCLGQDMQCS